MFVAYKQSVSSVIVLIMKKLSAILSVAAILASCSTTPTYKIRGYIEGLDGKMYMYDSGRMLVDSTDVVDGKFEFSGDCTVPMRCYIADHCGVTNFNQTAYVYVEQGVINISKEGAGYIAQGTPANDAYNRFMETIEPLDDEYMNDSTTDARRAEIDVLWDNIINDAIDSNLDNLFGLMEFKSMAYNMDAQETLDFLEKFSDDIKKTEEWKSIQDQANKKILVSVGKPYIDFTQDDPEGKPVSLKSVIEKEGNRYVLIDFWASWCGPCMGEVPFMLESYAAYHDKGFEIFGSSLDQSKENWIEAINDKKLDWVHVSDLKYWDNAAAEQYAVRSIPSNFLIDCSTGLIVATNLRGTNLRAKLAELLD